MSLTITKSDGSALLTVQDQTIDAASTSLRLPGRASYNYGDSYAHNMVWLMENFAAASAPKAPVAGQIWYDTGLAGLKVFDGSVWALVTGGVTVAVAPPPNPSLGMLWYFPGDDVLCTYVTDGTTRFWLAAGAQAPAQ